MGNLAANDNPVGRPSKHLQEVQAEYDRLASFYDRRWRHYLDATLRLAGECLECRGHEAVLDVPCGTGELEQRLLSRWPELRIVGVDVSQEMLRQAAAKDAGRTVQWLRADVCALPLGAEGFDWVICANSFHYFRSPALALAECARVLRRDGRLVLVDWCDDYRMCQLCSAWLRWTDPAFIRTYSLRDCRALLEQAGFVVESQRHCRVGWVWGMMRFVCRRA